MSRPSDAALWHSVASTLREVAEGSLAGVEARVAVVRLAGLAAYASARGADPAEARAAALATTLDTLAQNPVVAARWPAADRSAETVADVCAEVLVACVGRDDDAAVEVRAVLRPVLVGQVDDDLAEHAVLLDVYRGRLPRGAR